jgi:hypothetical protein
MKLKQLKKRQPTYGDITSDKDEICEREYAGVYRIENSNGDQRDFNAIFENFGKLKIISAQQIVKSKKQN